MRDTILTQAADIVREAPCRTLEVLEAPDNVRGVFVFREGLDEALAALPMNPSGETCVVRWTGSALTVVGDM